MQASVAPPAVLSSSRGKPAVIGRASSKRVLVIEDDPEVRQLIVRALGATYTVYEASDGADALELLAHMPQPDLILCDVMMPRVDGFMFARRIKAHREMARVPIVFLTARTDPMSVVEGINAGARQYLMKPFKMNELMERVGKILKVP